MRKSFKKTIALILSIVMILGVVPMSMSFAADTEGDFVYEIVDDEAIVLGYAGDATDVVIPETLGGKPVVNIGNRAPSTPVFHSNTYITSVVLPDTLEEIIPGSFYGCTNLVSIDLGGATKVGDTAFGGCTKLTTLTIGAELTTIDANAFVTGTIENVNYEGTIAQWNTLLTNIATGNESLLNATVVYCYGKNCEHDYAVESDSATCIADGVKKLVCIDCGYKTEEASYAKGHNYDLNNVIKYEEDEPTCTTGAVAIVLCTACNEQIRVWVPALGHSVAEGGWTIYEEPSCEGEGLKFGTCEVCQKGALEYIPALGHTENIIDAKLPTCTEAGYTESRYCTTCRTYTVTAQPEAALGHSYIKNADESSEPTCEIAGLYLNVCERCGDEKYEAVNALGHDIVYVDAQAPDCENFGWNDYEECTRCNYTTFIKISANGHTPGAVATCTTDQTCTDCDYVFERAFGHTAAVLEGRAADCESTGLTEGSWCTVCEVVLVPQQETTSLGHSYITTIPYLDSTCTEDGHTAEVACERCGDVAFESTVINKKGHVEKVIEAVNPTCTEPGSTAGLGCENCDEIFDQPQPIDALGHNPIDLERVEPTCTETGLTAGEKCNRCGEFTVEQKEIPALEHDMQMTVEEVDSTCTTVGKQAIYTCANGCGHTEGGEEIPVKNHSPKYVPAVAVTCTEVGYTAGAQCSVCNVFTAGHEEIPATGHTPGEEATCTDAQLCTECEFEIAPALGHDLVLDESVSVDATCLADGYAKADCSRCDYSYEGVVPATDHNIENWTIILYPTCKVKGQQLGFCINCMYDIKAEIPVVEHKDDNSDKKCDYCGVSVGVEDTPTEDEEEEDTDDGKCTCLCHAVGIRGLLYDFLLFIQRLFGLNKTCKCGVDHY